MTLTVVLLATLQARAAEEDLGGGGPAAAATRVTMPNVHTLAMRNAGVLPTEAVRAYIDGRETTAAHGDRQMPISGDVFRGLQQGTSQRTVQRRVAVLADFIESIQYR
jgi:hypothetical protein